MTSTNSEPSSSFLDHLHCSVCYSNFVASSRDPSSLDPATDGLQHSFWIGECKHVLCYKDLSGGSGCTEPVPKLLPDEIQAVCPACSCTVRLIRLRLDHLPDAARSILQPFETSVGELIIAYEFQFKQMSDLITFLKTQTSRQKQVLEHVKEELRQARKIKGEIEDARTEIRALKAKIAALESTSLHNTAGFHTQHGTPRAVNAGALGGGGPFLQPSRPFAFDKERNRDRRMPAQSSNRHDPANPTFNDRELQRYGPTSRPSTCSSEVFAYKPPPISFREMPPKTRGPSSPNRGHFRYQPSVPLNRPPQFPTSYIPAKQFASPLHQHSSKSSPGHDHSGSKGIPSQMKSPGSRSVPTLSRHEDQLPHLIPTNSWTTPNPTNFDLGTTPFAPGGFSVPVPNAAARDGVGGPQSLAIPHEPVVKAGK